MEDASVAAAMAESGTSPLACLGMSLLAGLSTTLGAGVVFCVPGQRITPGQMSFALALAGGVMVSVTVLEFWWPMLVGGKEPGPVVLFTLIGAACFWFLSKLVPEPDMAEGAAVAPGKQARDVDVQGDCEMQADEESQVIVGADANGENISVIGGAEVEGEKLSDPDVPHSASSISRRDPDAENLSDSGTQHASSSHNGLSTRRSVRLALVMMLSLTAHNFPEGFAVAVSATQSTRLGWVVMFAIAVHNVPEGIAIAVPVLAATGSQRRALWMSFLSGMAEPVGALTALVVLRLNNGSLSEASMENLLCVVGGVMCAVAVKELLPEAWKHGDARTVGAGVALGFLTMWVTTKLGA